MLILALTLIIPAGHSAATGCEDDEDCKEGRVCSADGQCIDGSTDTACSKDVDCSGDLICGSAGVCESAPVETYSSWATGDTSNRDIEDLETAPEEGQTELEDLWADYRSPGGFGYPNPAATRYLYAPSAIGLKQGQGYISQKLLFTAGAFAVTDNFSVLLGFLTPWPGGLSVLGTKLSVPVGEKLSLGIGGEAFLVPQDTDLAAGVAFGSVTYGHADRHVTVASGVIGGNPDYIFDGLMLPVMVGAHLRTSDRLAFVTENWIVTDLYYVADGGFPLAATANSAAIRLLGKRDLRERKRGFKHTEEGYPRATWDFGMVFLSFREPSDGGPRDSSSSERYTSFGPVPWVDYTWHFGTARK